MTTEERKATEAFHADLLDQFRENSAAMWPAKRRGDVETYAVTVEKARMLYRELREVEWCLRTGILPF